jgi:hypothetical protein
MMRFIDTITNKPNWDDKVQHGAVWCRHGKLIGSQVFEDTITAKWKKEALESPEDISETVVDHCIEELKIHAAIFKERGFVPVNDSGVNKSDTAVPAETAAALREAVKMLEDVPNKDWHPGSDEKVLDLVHPSLFQLVYGRSRVLKEPIALDKCIEYSGAGDVLPEPTDHGSKWSQKFQWLPCDVDLQTGKPEIKSYINNLHPTYHLALYPIIENIIGAAIPLWNDTLTEKDYEMRIHYTSVQYDPDPEDCRDDEIPNFPVRAEGETDAEYQERCDDARWNFQPVVQPEPDTKRTKEQILGVEGLRVNLERDYGKMQVIVKLANIVLSPEQPEYAGGSWHVEGQLVSSAGGFYSGG